MRPAYGRAVQHELIWFVPELLPQSRCYGLNVSRGTTTMRAVMRARNFAVLAVAALVLWPLVSQAQSAADFYKGRHVDLMIGYSVGGGYDVYGRMLARHLGKHMPSEPTIVPKNMEGAGSLRLANWLYNVAAKDGSVIGTIGRGTGFDPLLGHRAAQFDGTKFNWIGSANDEVSVCVAWTA